MISNINRKIIKEDINADHAINFIARRKLTTSIIASMNIEPEEP